MHAYQRRVPVRASLAELRMRNAAGIHAPPCGTRRGWTACPSVDSLPSPPRWWAVLLDCGRHSRASSGKRCKRLLGRWIWLTRYSEPPHVRKL